MLETGMSGLMSGEVKRSDAEGQSHRALPRLYNFTKRLASEAAELPFQVDVHLARHPLFVAFGEQGGHEAQARSGVWED